jgi:hypothetical protein
MPSNVGLYNQNTSLNSDTFDIQDVVAGGAIIASPTIVGGETFYFNCAPDDQGYGQVKIRNQQSDVWVNFDFVRDNDILRM